jgi:hypothetical protein
MKDEFWHPEGFVYAHTLLVDESFILDPVHLEAAIRGLCH